MRLGSTHPEHVGKVDIAPRIFGVGMLLAIGRQLLPQIRPGEVGAVALDQGRHAVAADRLVGSVLAVPGKAEWQMNAPLRLGSVARRHTLRMIDSYDTIGT